MLSSVLFKLKFGEILIIKVIKSRRKKIAFPFCSDKIFGFYQKQLLKKFLKKVIQHTAEILFRRHIMVSRIIDSCHLF